MASKVKAAVLVAPRQIEIEEFPLPETDDEDSLLRVEACGVCASDVPLYTGKVKSEGQLQMLLPVVLGHEIVGRVERLGKKAAERWGVKEGDRIIIERWIPCGHCDRCYAGDYRLCVRKIDGYPLYYGGSSTKLPPSLWGGFAEYMYLHPDTVVYKVSDRVSAELLPQFTPIANGISWVTVNGGAGVDSTVVIQGPGQEGLAAVIAAKEAGARLIIVTGLAQDAHRLQMAQELGATHTIVAEQEDVVERVKEITEERMADVVLDVTSGSSTKPIELAVDLAGQDGIIVLAGFHDNQPIANLVAEKMMSKTLTIKGVWGRHRRSVKAAIRLIESGRYPLHKLCTHAFPLEETGQAFRVVAREVDRDALHVSVIPRHSEA